MRRVRWWLRRYWPDGNPLRRRADRLEAAGLLVAVLLVTACVWPAVAAGRQTHDSAADDRGRVRVMATLLADAPVTHLSFGAVAAGQTTAARWATPSGEQRTGQVRAPARAKAGARVPLWVDAAGRPALAPPGRLALQVTAVATGTLVWAVSAALVAAAFAGFRRLLDRARYRAWDAAWISQTRERRP
ncbi:Rv1733c family protein [Nonomuraea sp. SYSU D8015]|uniref:Rv1733c family protein n=1 Tax=Nonomuraea sp. SYSU D8015 TaxID=2593644 RepID=UPI001660BB62|nr:hypothetical protein [Nonomuraea sp. SYSU D8015]